jgi:iron complex outermembrane receptor protein
MNENRRQKFVFIRLTDAPRCLLTVILIASFAFAENTEHSEHAHHHDMIAVDTKNKTVPADGGIIQTSLAQELPLIVVKAKSEQLGALSSELNKQRSSNSDTARLLENFSGVFNYAAGGISSLPVVRGLADDRIRISVDGMDLMSACPNHMNPALSYIAPSKVESIVVYAGVAPVSEGGDNIGGTIKVESAAPRFASLEEGFWEEGEAGYFWHSNGRANGYHLNAAIANTWLNLSFSQSESESENYRAAGDFKLPGVWKSLGQYPIRDDEVASSAYSGALNRDISASLLFFDDHLLRFGYGEQSVEYENFPNQRMDMLSSHPNGAYGDWVIDKEEPSNVNRILNLKYDGDYEWGKAEADVFRQNLRHHMEMNPERFGAMMMPMDAKSITTGGTLKLSFPLTLEQQLNIGGDFQSYRLDDWWPPIGMSGAMCCEDFWNIRDGKRDRIGMFAELKTQWNTKWQTIFGLRGGLVKSDTGEVQGYNPSYGNDANNLNSQSRAKTDKHFDFTVLAKFEPTELQNYEFGIARKSRSPNLYERYSWSKNGMALVMNNFVGDGNGYVGNIDLKPEIAHTLSLNGVWHDAAKENWEFKISGYVTHVKDYIDAQRCPANPISGACNTLNLNASNKYVALQYVNQNALLYGIDIAGNMLIGKTTSIGAFSSGAALSYLRGKNRTTGDDLYHIMPFNAKLTLQHQLSGWTNVLETAFVSAKKHVSKVRSEMPTPGYTLFNLKSIYERKHFSIEVAIENLFDKLYYEPLGGAYIGQGNSMTLGGIPYGMVVPGRGRSVNVALNLKF